MLICVDLGATNIKSALFNEQTATLARGPYEVPTCANDGKEGITRALKGAISLCLTDTAKTSIKGVALSSAGNIDSRTATIIYATDNLRGMTGFSFAAFCQQEFGLPVWAINDAQAALLGELTYGAGKAFVDRRVAMLTLGSGVGGGYSVKGALISNEQNDYARFGHLCLVPNGKVCTCGKRGCIEMYLSGRAIHAEAKMRGIDGDDLFIKMKQGEPAYAAYMGYLRDIMARSLKLVNGVCSFDICLIGGGVADWMGDMFGAMTKDLGYTLVRASLGNAAGMYGALAFAKKSWGSEAS